MSYQPIRIHITSIPVSQYNKVKTTYVWYSATSYNKLKSSHTGGRAMTGVTHLPKLLANLEPSLHSTKYVFCSLESARLSDTFELDPICTFKENEGLTVVVSEDTAVQHKLEASPPFACITITINSSLEAVGMTAAMSAALASCGISANVVAAYHHDHIFVPADRADDAIKALKELQQRSLNASDNN